MSTPTAPLLHTVWPADPRMPDCPHLAWREHTVGGIFWRCCRQCAYTECSLPGVDMCLYEAPLVALHGPLRLLEAIAAPCCETLTTGRCPACRIPVCSDHLAVHRRHDCLEASHV